jgi:signal transduction histidine kinase/CheY-like chemotaxis protein/predicted Ser/Thr protein kinase
MIESPPAIAGLVFDGELGHGAYSIVYRARHGEHACAVKIARRGGRHGRWFRREAAALARVRHPGVPAVLEVGEAGDRPYLAMELVSGQTLADRLRQGRLSLEEGIGLGLELAQIVVAIHDRGLVHRDIKPRNIVVSEVSEVRLVDFGLATHAFPRADGGAAGTRSYAAPEQLDAPHLVDGRADLFALGRVLEESVVVDGQLGVQRILEGLLAPAIADRYETARDVVADLRLAQAGRAPLGPGRRCGDAEDPPVVPLVGRSDELRQLEVAWTHAGRGRGSVFLVEGRPGGGKTRLLDEFVRRVGRSASHLCLRAGGGSPVPLAAVRRLFDHYLDVAERRPAPERDAWVARLRASVETHAEANVAAVSPRLATALGLGAPARDPDPEALAENIAGVLVRLAREIGAILVVVDDLQWLDPVSREVLVRVALSTDEAPVLFVAAARSDARSLPPLQRFGRALGSKRLTVMSVRPLSDGQLHDLLAAYLGVDSVEPALVRKVAGLSDGTPLSALDMVGALIDRGALRPHWGAWAFDAESSQTVDLSPGSIAHLTRRLEDTPEATVAVLRTAAVIGADFDVGLLARAVGVTEGDVELAMSEASRAGVIEYDRRGAPRFVHDTLREALVAAMSARQKQAAHRTIARVLSDNRPHDSNALFRIADHLWAGGPCEAPAEAHELGRQAAARAAEVADHETALRCFTLAREAAAQIELALPLSFLRAEAESSIAVGALAEGLGTLHEALAVTEGLERAAVLSRLAWVHAALGDEAAAWDTLARAFQTVGARLPTERVGSIAGTLVDSGRLAVGRPGRPVRAAAERRRLEMLCDLHYQTARLATETDKPLRVVQSSVSMLRTAQRLGPSRQLVRAESGYGAFITVLGRKGAGWKHVERAEAGAQRLADPALIAHTLQHAILMRYWAGQTQEATAKTKDLLDRYGAWLEVTEYGLLVISARSIESLRGRPRESLAWLHRAIDRIRRHGRLPTVFSQVVVPALHATLATLGREEDAETILAGLDFEAEDRGTSIFRVANWGPRALTLLSRGQIGAELDALVAEFATLKQDPKRAHIILGEYYYCVAYARAARCEAAAESERGGLLADLDAAITDFAKASRVDAFKAHLLALQGDRARLAGDFKRARARLAKARDLAEQESAPWVLYEVARAEARMLRSEGRLDAARDRAMVAAVAAQSHGARPRLRAILEEFELEAFASTTGSSAGNSRSMAGAASNHNLQLRALVKVVNAAAQEQRLDAQARAVLDELLRVVRVDRGILLFERGEPDAARLLTARTRAGDDWDSSGDGYPRLLKQISDQGRPVGSGEEDSLSESSGTFDTLRLIGVPLFVQSEVAGALVLQRGPAEPCFTTRDLDLVAALSPQVPIALELARLLEERQRLQETLRQAQKMEGVGQLASGIAHDFNNMLTAIMSSLDALGDVSRLSAGQAEAVDVVRDSAERASQLTRQLLSFSRRQVLDMTTLDVGEAIAAVIPMLVRMLGKEIDVRLAQEGGPYFAQTDRSSLDNMIVNLAVNARDAMTDGGRVDIIVDGIEVDESMVAQGASRTGPHVRIRVIDSGSGMPPEVVAKVFEPFFTTKAVGSGTGLGLASAYGFVKQCGGHIDVTSEMGKGSAFTIILPVSDVVPVVRPVSKPQPIAHATTITILVVEDEPLVRRATEAILQRQGYEVCFAEHGEEALAIVHSGASVDLVVTDVQMPTMDGPTFVRHLVEAGYRIPVLLVSGYADPSVIQKLDAAAGVEFLAKPYSRDELLQRIERLFAGA